MKFQIRDLLIHTNFLTMKFSNQVYCYKQVFTHMNISMIGKNLMKHHYQKKISTVT